MNHSAYLTPDQLNQLPLEPGVYKFFDKNNILIYVGKSKSIRKRVSSYFNRSTHYNRKVAKLISDINTIEFTIANTEYDAILLESNLIKEHRPKYNINLKDGKTHPYICVTNEPFPRIFPTRKLHKKQGKYFGPFASVGTMNVLLELIKKLYTIRACKLNLSKKNISQGKFKVCLEYHIGNCKGPCEKLQLEEGYLEEIHQANQILNGNLAPVKSYLKKQIHGYAELLEFEKAAQIKQKLDSIEDYQSKSLVTTANHHDLDVITVIGGEKYAFANYLKIKNGMISITKTMEIKKKLEEKDTDLAMLVLTRMRNEFESLAKEVLTNVDWGHESGQYQVVVPKIGHKRKLVELSLKNCLFQKQEKLKAKEKKQVQSTSVKIMEIAQKDLRLLGLPDHIECFDNSNLQGSNPVGSMVCFKNAKPSKKDYRHFNIKTVIGPNDFESMYEIVHRRYKRLVEERAPLPKLIVVDGGKGQVGSAVAALKNLGIYSQIPIIGIAKKLEEIYYPHDDVPLHIDRKSPTLKLIQQLRNESHRFAITFHRNKRSKSAIKPKLEEIPGIGTKTIEVLLKNYKSNSGIKSASKENLIKLLGQKKANLIHKHFAKE